MRVLNIRGRIRGEFMQKCTNIKCNSNNPNFKVMRLEKPIKARVDPELSKGGGSNFCQMCKLSGWLWGHAPPEIFENLSL